MLVISTVQGAHPAKTIGPVRRLELVKSGFRRV